MYKQILVPLDGSALAEMSIPHAISLAYATSSTITLLRSVPPLYMTLPMAGGFPASSEVWEAAAEEPEHAREYLAGLAARIRSEVDDLVIETEVVDGDPASAIVHYAEQHPGIKLIAMATHGRSGVSRWIFGSVAEKILQSSPVPLLIVRPPSGEEANLKLSLLSPRYDKILVPLDGSEFAEHALEQAEVIACSSGATLVLLTVEHTLHESILAETRSGVERVAASWEKKQAEEYLREVARQSMEGQHGTTLHAIETQQAHLKVQTQISFGDPAEEILKAGAQDRVDMIVMTTHGRSGLKRLWLGSVAVKVVRGTTLPVLLVRAKERVKAVEAEHKASTVTLVTPQAVA